MKDAKDLIPWTVTDISIRPYDGFWSMNPSILFDGQTWRVVLRCCDYAMPGGKTIRSPKAGPGHQTKNAMIILDPATWQPIKIFKMRELDEHPRVASASIGYEDMRIFKTDRGGLQGIAASLHLARDTRPAAGGAQHQPPEQVLLSFDDEYNIVKARPIRGDSWSGTAQKNWSPFTDCAEPRFLYSIGKGSMFDDRGPVHGDAAVVRPSSSVRAPAAPTASEHAEGAEQREARERQENEEKAQREDRERQEQQESQEKERRMAEKRAKKEREEQEKRNQRSRLGGADVASVRGRRVSHDTTTSRPSYMAHHAAKHTGGRLNTESARTMSAGRILLPKYEGLRGGTQLVRVGDDAWLGIGHEMRFDRGLKYYWHVFYSVDARGKLKSVSPPCKLAPEGIEFAAGMAIDGDRVVVSFGVDDEKCRLGETSLSAVLGILRPVEQ
jgi:hypothetical protein